MGLISLPNTICLLSQLSKEIQNSGRVYKKHKETAREGFPFGCCLTDGSEEVGIFAY